MLRQPLLAGLLDHSHLLHMACYSGQLVLLFPVGGKMMVYQVLVELKHANLRRFVITNFLSDFQSGFFALSESLLLL